MAFTERIDNRMIARKTCLRSPHRVSSPPLPTLQRRCALAAPTMIFIYIILRINKAGRFPQHI